jgi:hypothetical protein
MIKRLQTIVGFACGCLFTLAALLRCGARAPEVLKRAEDGGVARVDDAGLMMQAMADELTQAGTRLKPQIYQSTDGARQFVGWWDSTLQTACAFGTASDGVTRCLPTGTPPNYGNDGIFSDSACTMPLALTLPSSCSSPQYAAGPAATTCPPAGPTFYKVLGKATSTTVWARASNSCVSEPVSAIGGYVLWQLGPAIDPSSFVQATLGTDQ